MEQGNASFYSRRSFVKGVALAGSGIAALGALSACAPKATSDAGQDAGSATVGAGSAEGVSWTSEADVVVVGFGGAGSAAAIEAAEAGASVVLLELNSQGGGSTAANGGYIMMGGTDLQKKFGIEDSTENFYAYLSAAAGENADDDAIRLVCESAPDLYRWLVEHGMDFESGICDENRNLSADKGGISLMYSGNERARDFAAVAAPAPRGHCPQPGSTGQDMFAALKGAVEAAGVEVMYETPGASLLTDGGGRVVGIAAKGPKGDVFVKAKRGVVLTCGGFVDNEAMLNANYPFLNKRGPRLTTAGSENGSGILMGLALDAATRGMGCFQIGYTIVTFSEPLAQGILVDGTGRRIVAEDEYNSFLGRAIIMAPTSSCYLIVDDATRAEGGGKLGDPLVSSSDLGEIAAKTGIDPDVLQRTVAFYNESAALGSDREFGKKQQFLKALDEGTLHVFAAGSEQCYTASCGGLAIDLDAHVLGNDGEIISGLYAAGRNAGTIYGWYMGSGSSMLDVLVFGRIAGRNAAAEASTE